MFSKITFLVALATCTGIILYNIFILKRVITGPIDGGGVLILITPILLAFIAGIVVITKNADTKPLLNVAAYIVLTVGLLWTTSYISDMVRARKYATYKIEQQALYEEVSKNGECLINLEVGRRRYEIYYYNESLYDIDFLDNKRSYVSCRSPKVNIDESKYFRVYEVNKKYQLLIDEEGLNMFRGWLIYVENVGYMYLGERYLAMYIIENNEYTVLDEATDAKIQKKWRK